MSNPETTKEKDPTPAKKSDKKVDNKPDNKVTYMPYVNPIEADATYVRRPNVLPIRQLQREVAVSNVKKPTKIDLKVLSQDALIEQAKDPDIKNAVEKILGKELDGRIINNLVINQDVFKNKTVSEYTSNVARKHPELVFFMSSLGLGECADKKYERLLPSQKLALLALEDTLNGKRLNLIKTDNYSSNNGKIDIAKFQSTYANRMKDILGHLNDEAIITQATNLGDLKKTLKNEYKLTEIELKKYMQYAEAIKNQPAAVNEAGRGAGFGIGIIVGVILGALGAYGLYKLFGPSETQSTMQNEVEIQAPENIAKMLSSDVPFHVNSVYEKDQRAVNQGDAVWEQFLKEVGNKFQNRKIVMQVDGKMAIEYDISADDPNFKKRNLQTVFYRDANMLKIRLKNPKPIVHEFKSEILDDNTQVFQTRDFVNMPMVLQDSVFSTVKGHINRDPSYLEASVGHVARNFYHLYAPVLPMGGMRIDTLVVQIVDDNGNEIMTKGFGAKILSEPAKSPDNQKPININIENLNR